MIRQGWEDKCEVIGRGSSASPNACRLSVVVAVVCRGLSASPNACHLSVVVAVVCRGLSASPNACHLSVVVAVMCHLCLCQLSNCNYCKPTE